MTTDADDDYVGFRLERRPLLHAILHSEIVAIARVLKFSEKKEVARLCLLHFFTGEAAREIEVWANPPVFCKPHEWFQTGELIIVLIGPSRLPPRFPRYHTFGYTGRLPIVELPSGRSVLAHYGDESSLQGFSFSPYKDEIWSSDYYTFVQQITAYLRHNNSVSEKE